MTADARRLLEQVLALPVEQRAMIAAELRGSLGETEGSVEDAWGREIARRVGEIDRGEVELIPGDVVRAELRRIAARRT